MRRLLPPLLILALAAGPALAAPEAGTMQRKEGVRDAVTAPLEDLNLKQVDIPEVLKRAQARPYDTDDLQTCEAIAGEIGRLDGALGPDLDEAPPPDKRSRAAKVAGAAHDAGVAEIRHETQGLLPFRGWIRQLTGAARHDKQVQAAIRAGAIRRGYLKGMGMHMNCAPPAAPSWFVPKHEAAKLSPWDAFWHALFQWIRSWWPF
jgi:hypothetical protein